MCESAEVQVTAMERERRADRSARAKAEKAVERFVEAKRDAKVWKEAIAYWCEAFPDKRVTSKGVKSARATKFFQRLDAGATVEDVRYAIDAAKVWQYVVFGKRQKSGSRSDLATDLEHICSVGNDAQFDGLVEIGRALEREAW